MHPEIFTRELRSLRRRVGRNIHEARVRRRMPLAKLARAAGLDADVIDRLELGKDEVRLDHLVRIAHGLGMDAGALTAGSFQRV